jgi:hypothetical protein
VYVAGVLDHTAFADSTGGITDFARNSAVTAARLDLARAVGAPGTTTGVSVEGGAIGDTHLSQSGTTMEALLGMTHGASGDSSFLLHPSAGAAAIQVIPRDALFSLGFELGNSLYYLKGDTLTRLALDAGSVGKVPVSGGPNNDIT